MDLYEALKAGTSADDLIKAFHDDLDKANARIAEEKEAEARKYLKECRTFLAEAVLDYADALLGGIDDTSFTTEEIEEILKNFEKEMKPTLDLCEKINKSKFFDDDDAIINNFLNKLNK